MKESKTIVTKQREKFTSNRQSFETALGLSIFDYNNLQFEQGITFLEALFPRNSEYERYYLLYSQSATFWKWWRIEYNIWEDGLMAFINEHRMSITMNLYKNDIKRPEIMARLESSFQHQYLKYFQDMIITK